MPLKRYKLPFKLIQSARISILFLLFSHVTAPAAACHLPTTLTHSVIAISDNRTLHLDNGTQLRLAAILPPTSYDIPTATAASPWPPAIAAKAFIMAETLHRSIGISLDHNARDRYGRRVGHALLLTPPRETNDTPAQNWLQAKLVAAGHARVTLTPEIDAPCAHHLLALEAEAHASGLGLWQQATYKPKRAEDSDDLLRHRSSYQIVEGVVRRVAVLKYAVYLNFGPDWRRDFSAQLNAAMLKRFKIQPASLKALKNSPLRLRGWIEKRNGPMMTIGRIEQIEHLTLTVAGKTKRSAPPQLFSPAPAKYP